MSGLNATHEAFPMGYITDDLMEATFIEQTTLIAGLDQDPSLHVVLTNNSTPNRSYWDQSQAWGDRVRGNVVQHKFDDDYRAAAFIEQDLGTDKNVDGVLALLPSWTRDGEPAIRKAIHPDQDVDGATLQVATPHLIPATTEAMWKVAEELAQCGLKEAGAIGVLGYGARTLKPLVDRVMYGMGIEPAFILKSGTELRAFQEFGVGVDQLRECDLVFSAVPIGIMLTPDRVRAGQKIVDVGTGGTSPLTGKRCGNVDPRVFGMIDVEATAFRSSVGQITSAISFGRAVDTRIGKERKTKAGILARTAFAAA